MAEFNIDGAEFSVYGGEILKLLETYLADLPKKAVSPTFEPGQLATKFPDKPPQQACSLSETLTELKQTILPGATHWQHPRFMSYFPATTSVPAMFAELVVSAIGSVGLQWSANPIATELECVVMDWLVSMLGFPKDSPFYHTSKRGGGLIQNTAGDALVVILTGVTTVTCPG